MPSLRLNGQTCAALALLITQITVSAVARNTLNHQGVSPQLGCAATRLLQHFHLPRSPDQLLTQYTTQENGEQILFTGEGEVLPPRPAAEGSWTVRVPTPAYMRLTVRGGNMQNDNLLLGFVNERQSTANLAMIGQGMTPSSGSWGLIADVALTTPLMPCLWSDRRAHLGCALRLLLLVLAFAILRSHILDARRVAGAWVEACAADQMMSTVIDHVSLVSACTWRLRATSISRRCKSGAFWRRATQIELREHRPKNYKKNQASL